MVNLRGLLGVEMVLCVECGGGWGGWFKVGFSSKLVLSVVGLLELGIR